MNRALVVLVCCAFAPLFPAWAGGADGPATRRVLAQDRGRVVVLDGAGAVEWEYRLANGNTLIGCGNGNRVIEVTTEGKVVWGVEHKELPGITLAWVTMLHVLPGGNVVIGNGHAGPENPQLIEVTREKRVVWTLKDHKTLGNSTAASEVLGVGGGGVR